jgi:hypothetical protein
VASPIAGNEEVVCAPAAGLIAAARTPAAIADAVLRLAADPPPRAATASYAAGFGWGPVSQGQLDLFGDVLAARRRPAAA